MNKEALAAIIIVLAVALMLAVSDKSLQIGGQKDSHGCYIAAGYSWCAASSKCIRPWETYCDAATLEKLAQGYCNGENVASVFTCGQYVGVVSLATGGGTTFYSPGKMEISCPVVGPDAMTDACKQLELGSNCVQTKVC